MSFGNRSYDLDRSKPEIDFPGEQPPAELRIIDEIEGTGSEVAPGNTIAAHYVGVAWSTGEEFDSSWNRGTPLQFTAGIGQVITGWDRGLIGMKVGGRRRLEIPADLAYGHRGAPPAIGPDEALIFVVDLVGLS